MIADRESSLVIPAANPPVMRVDFAGVFNDHLFVYGWIFDLFREVVRADLKHAEVVIDLMSLAIPVPRPDVTQHFAEQVAAVDDHHGFCLLVALPDTGVRPSYLRLAVSLRSGKTVDRAWPIEVGEHNVKKFLENNPYTFNWLQQNLPVAEAARLRALSSPGVHMVHDLADRPARALQLLFGVDDCCLLKGRLLIMAGWVSERDRRLTAAEVRLGGATVEFSDEIGEFPYPVGDSPLHPSLRGNVVAKIGITAVVVLPTPLAMSTEAVFDLFAGPKQMRVRRDLADSSSSSNEPLAALFARLDADAAISLMERVAACLDEVADRLVLEWLTEELRKAVQRLPVSLQSDVPRAFVHIDWVSSVAGAGMFLNGWYFNASDGGCEIACHCGFTRLRIDEGFVRMTRPDVSAHLQSLGFAAPENEHGFICYVPLPDSAPYFISLTDASGKVRRMRLVRQAHPPGTLQVVRSLVTSFTAGHRELRVLLERHIGPAVKQVWERRSPVNRALVTHRFGPAPPTPDVSVVVPLYGRYDLAEYQMALFADDADFQRFELIYFVDDPAMYDEFKAHCHDLFEIYRVPFTVMYAGANLGFAGANNCAAGVATGRNLLLLNSDVMPKQTGWLGQMNDLYRTLEDPGMLGAKLLYEDGSVQHAGMTFRRHPGWDGMWINEHLHKGQSPLGLNGVRHVDAVTAACVLVEAALYRRLGGLSEDFIIGDFEDSDFCLRAEAAGRRHYVALDIELYHLERQSQDRIGDVHWRNNLTLYNCWLHDQRWATQIECRKR